MRNASLGYRTWVRTVIRYAVCASAMFVYRNVNVSNVRYGRSSSLKNILGIDKDWRKAGQESKDLDIS